MKKSVAALLFTVAVSIMVMDPVYAQNIGNLLPDSNTPEEKPPQQMPIIPVAEKPAPTVKVVQVPELPPSLPCKKKWLFGLWELKNVYESPLGVETEAFNQSPAQYIGFKRDTRFFRYNAGKSRMDPKMVYKTVNEHSGALLQHLLQDGGMLYIYQDSVATDTLVCFVVAETKPPFGAGNLILMPPKGAITGRLIKVYRKVWPPKNQPPPPNPNHKPTPHVRWHRGGR